MIMSEIRSNNYHVFQDKGLNQRALSNYINSLKYIDHLASVTKTDIGSWDILKLFAAENEGGIHIDKRKINELFFSLRESGVTNAEINLPKETIAAIGATLQEATNAYTNRLKSELRSTRESAAEHERRFRNAYDAIKGLENKIASASSTDQLPKLISQIESICSQGYYEFPQQISGVLKFKMKHELILREYNRKAGVDISVNMGRPTIDVSLADFSVFVNKDPKNQTIINNYWHPHVDSTNGGKLCTGELAVEFGRAQANKNIYELLSIAYFLLTNFNGGSAYVQLHSLRDKAISVARANGLPSEPTEREKAAEAEQQRTNIIERVSVVGGLGQPLDWHETFFFDETLPDALREISSGDFAFRDGIAPLVRRNGEEFCNYFTAQTERGITIRARVSKQILETSNPNDIINALRGVFGTYQRISSITGEDIERAY